MRAGRRGVSHGRVLVTRPAGAAERTAAALRARGWTPVLAPVLSLRFLPAVLPPADRYDFLIFTSAHGVAAFAALTPEGPGAFARLPVYAVGPQTADAARRAGFADVRCGPGTARALEDGLSRDPPGGSGDGPGRFLHLSGTPAAHVFALPGADRLVIYEAEGVPALPVPCCDDLENGRVDVALFYSPRSAALFSGLLEKHGLTHRVPAIKALCLADSVVKSLKGLPWQEICLASSPDGEGMMAALDGLVPAGGASRRP